MPLAFPEPASRPSRADGSAESSEWTGPFPAEQRPGAGRSRSRAPRSCPEHSPPLALPARTAFLCREGQLGGCLVLFAFKFSVTQASCCSIRRLATKRVLSSRSSANRQKQSGQARSSGRVPCRWGQSRLLPQQPLPGHLAQASVVSAPPSLDWGH